MAASIIWRIWDIKEAKQGQIYEITVFLCGRTAQQSKQRLQGIREYASEQNIQLSMIDLSKRETSEQGERIEAELKYGIDGIWVDMPDAALKETLEKAAQKVPIVFTDADWNSNIMTQLRYHYEEMGIRLLEEACNGNKTDTCIIVTKKETIGNETDIQNKIILDFISSEGKKRNITIKQMECNDFSKYEGACIAIGIGTDPDLLALLEQGKIQKLLVLDEFGKGYMAGKLLKEMIHSPARIMEEKMENEYFIISPDTMFDAKYEKIVFTER